MQLKVYRCRQCRHLLMSSRNVVQVSDGAGQEAFPFRKRDKAAQGSQAGGAGAVFIEPMQWMEGLWQIAGKLYCPKYVSSTLPHCVQPACVPRCNPNTCLRCNGVVIQTMRHA